MLTNSLATSLPVHKKHRQPNNNINMDTKVRVLNEGEIPKDRSARSAVALSKDLQKIMLKMKGSFMSADGRRVDYTKLRKSKLFEEYQISARDLQETKLSDLSPAEKTAFFLSIQLLIDYSVSKW